MGVYRRLVSAVMIFVLLYMLFLGISLVAFGQTPNGTIVGTVFYNDGKTVIPGTTVELEPPLSGSILRTTTDESGQYSFNVAPPPVNELNPTYRIRTWYMNSYTSWESVDVISGRTVTKNLVTVWAAPRTLTNKS